MTPKAYVAPQVSLIVASPDRLVSETGTRAEAGTTIGFWPDAEIYPVIEIATDVTGGSNLSLMWGPVTKLNNVKDHVAVLGLGDQRQADYFRDELCRQIDLLAERVARFQAKLAVSSKRGQLDQVRLMQTQLRHCAVERRIILEMLAELSRCFPADVGAEARR